ncbi:MAG TPA: hydrogenase accessory protein HypB [Myxococcales bacterium]|nr:hydrogenase accessory protein HypB [Myxococcales bacterium]
MTEVTVAQEVLHDNTRDAKANRQRFDEAGVYVLNLMSGPGAGKTTLLERTAEALKARLKVAIITGDLETRRDADRLGSHGIPALQINTGGACHIEAHQIAKACDRLELKALDLLIIENVGNLVCPAEFELGEHDKAMILSCAEGHDKPGKYPLMFRESRAMLLNKIDLLPYTDFDLDAAVRDARALNPKLEVLKMSARTGEGLEEWFGWVEARCQALRAGRSS